jgi:hypothetical protein
MGSLSGSLPPVRQLDIKKTQMKLRYITQGALDAKSRVGAWNDSLTTELTMAVTEVVDLTQRFFVDIDSTISDELMGKLLHHFKEEGTLIDREDMARV